MSTPPLVTTTYVGRGRFGGLHTRLHRADCRTLRPDTRTEPWTPGTTFTRGCRVCKPLSETSR
jgi:hypothetical protein